MKKISRNDSSKLRAVPGDLRRHNRGLVLEHLFRASTVSRTALSEATGLTPAAVSRITRELVEAGLVHELAHEGGQAARRRPQVDLELASEGACVIGIGVGAYIEQMRGQSYIEFLAPGLICVAAMNGSSFEVTYNIYVRLAFEKAYDAMLTTPLQPEDVLVGETLWAVTRSCLYGGIFFLVVALFGLVPLPSGLLAVLVIPLTGLLFAAIGLAFTLHIPAIDLYSFYFTLFLTPLFLIASAIMKTAS